MHRRKDDFILCPMLCVALLILKTLISFHSFLDQSTKIDFPEYARARFPFRNMHGQGSLSVPVAQPRALKH